MSPDLAAALLSWAVTLSGYPAPSVPPTVVEVDHSFFVEHACNGVECKVWGWYEGGTNLYVDRRADPQASLLASSIVVHEMVHYLQAQARGVSHECPEIVAREMEAYGVQREYVVRYGDSIPIGVSMADVHCEPAEETR